MNRTRAKELLPIITAFANGETIQWTTLGRSDWEDLRDPCWSDDLLYRVKPKPRLRPWTPEEAPKWMVLRPKKDHNEGRPRVWRFVDGGTLACCTPYGSLVSERMDLMSALMSYVRIDEQGNEHPCGVVCEDSK